MTKTILFLGATGGCGLSALRNSLAAGHTCVALCRTPARLTAQLSAAEQSGSAGARLRIEQGNAHDAEAVARALVHPPLSETKGSRLVDAVVFTIGGAFSAARFGLDDPHVCETGITALLTALQRCRADFGVKGNPLIVAVSSTGITTSGQRDLPLLMMPLYHVMLRQPHADKRAMEQALIAASATGERFTVMRPSLLIDSPAKLGTPVRVGVEDLVTATVESRAIGYTIHRDDVGKWIFENLLDGSGGGGGGDRWVGKAVTVTY